MGCALLESNFPRCDDAPYVLIIRNQTVGVQLSVQSFWYFTLLPDCRSTKKYYEN